MSQYSRQMLDGHIYDKKKQQHSYQGGGLCFWLLIRWRGCQSQDCARLMCWCTPSIHTAPFLSLCFYWHKQEYFVTEPVQNQLERSLYGTVFASFIVEKWSKHLTYLPPQPITTYPCLIGFPTLVAC